MKIGILTFHFSDNFGALLQAYGLREYLRSLGHEAEFVNYQPAHVEGGGKIRIGLSKQAAVSNLKVAYMAVSGVMQKLLTSEKTRRGIDSFQKKNLGVVGEAVTTIEEVPKLADGFEVLICGSDQIWNPSDQFGIDPAYFLGFESTAKRKVSYAPSFGSGSLDARYRDEVTVLLRGLDGISVREESAVELVNELIEYTPVCVPDPTFLVDDYKALIGEGTPKKDHIFAYILRSSQDIHPMCDALSGKLGVPVRSAWNPYRRWKDFGEGIEGGPTEWLQELADSKFVITNSFHGTVFSILMNRPFIAARLPGAKAKLSGRLENLLEKVGLSDRLVTAGDIWECLAIAEKDIDWDAVNAKVSGMRQIGRDFLSAELERARV
ncbi:polysaccharide pyruvyl transferase family protein [Luteolibacter sp. AS25]|uniref:polysaccharide pyruvyl transferase family protein n=1 Tax=Luteolibacter sp. AS25 TaxID=3135776 RepID=UPI00398B89A3